MTSRAFGRERRERMLRIALPILVLVLVLVLWEAIVRNISSDGIGLLLGRRFEPGVLLAIEVTDKNDGPMPLLLARVIHATARPEGGWLIGCCLVPAARALAADGLVILPTECKLSTSQSRQHLIVHDLERGDVGRAHGVRLGGVPGQSGPVDVPGTQHPRGAVRC